jgi:CO/xanthine dehydrogenase FAD-binding subunit
VKPAEFDYRAPRTLDDALELKAGAGSEGSLLAGGQSLVPLLNMRLARPQLVIDLNRVEGLDFIELRDEAIVVGAMTRQRSLERSELAHDHCPLLRETLQNVAHAPIRNRGTVGGSIAHAAAAAELPATLVALGGSVTVMGPAGRRDISATEFFRFHFVTAIAPDEIVVALNFPVVRPGTGWSFMELSRRHGDFALAGVAAVTHSSGARLGFAGVGSTPVLVESDDPAVVMAALNPTSDVHASGEYRRTLAGTLTERAVRVARSREASTES